MSTPIVIAKNQTASALPLSQIPVDDNEIPASGQVTLTDFASISEIQEDTELAVHIAATDVILNVDGVDLSVADSTAWMVLLTVATIAEVDAGTVGDKAISPATLSGSVLATNVSANLLKVSADGSVTTHSDVTNAGSGVIITVGERSDIATNNAKVSAGGSVTTHSDVTSVGSGAIITVGERTTLTNQSGTNTGDEAAASETVAGVLETATTAEVNTGTDTGRAVSPSSLANSTLASNVTTNTAKVSADGLVTTHSDVSDAGSGLIISGVERTKLTGIESSADVTDAANVASAGALMTTLADAKGDIFVATANDTIIRLPVGTDTHVLTLDSAEASGVKWAAGGGGGTAAYVDFYGSGITSVMTSATTLALNTERQSNAAFVLSGNQVTVAAGAGGDYRVSFDVTFDESDSNKRCVETWLEVDGSEVVAMRARGAHADSDIDDTSGREAILTLAAGEVLRLRSQVTNGSASYDTLAGGVSLMIHTIGGTGAVGAQGPAGSGSTITVKDDGVTVAGGPHDTINFQGMEGEDAGGGTANIKNVYGSEYESELDKTYRSTTSTSYFEAHKFTTQSKPAGTYRIEFNYIWSYNDTGQNFRCRVTVDDTTQLYEQDSGGSSSYDLHQQEPKDKDGSGDGGTDQRHITSYWADVTFVSSDTHEIDIDISSSSNGKLTSIHRSTIAIYRVS